MSMRDDQITLREYVTMLMSEHDLRYSERHEAQKDAISKLATQYAADKAQSNEWRMTIKDQSSLFITVPQYTALEDKVSLITAKLERGDGKNSGIGLSWAILLAVTGLIIAYINLHH